jgi:hypothetical protein
VRFKKSEEAKERSRINKINAANKKWHHTLGPGGYQVGWPKWDLAEEQMIAAGATSVTLSCPPRCRTWFYVHGGKLDPETGLVMERASLKEASDALIVAIKDAQTGAFKPERENDELMRALKNPEHPGRVGKCCMEKQKKFYAHAMIYPWRCIATRARVCLHTLVDRKWKRFTTRLM